MADGARKMTAIPDQHHLGSPCPLTVRTSFIGTNQSYPIDICTPPPSEHAFSDDGDAVDITPGSTSAASMLLSPSADLVRAPTPAVSPIRKVLSTAAPSDTSSTSSARTSSSGSPTWATERRKAIHVTDVKRPQGRANRWLLSPDEDAGRLVGQSSPLAPPFAVRSSLITLSSIAPLLVEEEVDELDSTDDEAEHIGHGGNLAVRARSGAESNSLTEMCISASAPTSNYRDQAVQTSSISEAERRDFTRAVRALIEALAPLDTGL